MNELREAGGKAVFNGRMNKYVLQLFVNGNSITSLEAIATLKSICRENLQDNCDLEIVDIQQDPDKAEEAGILAIPTLIRKWPLPETRIIGALSVKTRVLTGLGIGSE